MIGADDYFVCVAQTHDGCSSPAEQSAFLATLRRNVSTILSAIRNKAHYTGQLVILNYYSLDYASTPSNALSIGLNNAVDSGAQPFHVVVADGFAEAKNAVVQFGGHSCEGGLLTQLGAPGHCGIHPSYAGASLLAQAVARVVRLR